MSDLKLPKLGKRQQKFADEYLIDLNATRAAIRAGYSPKSAAQQGCELLKNPKVSAYVEARMAELSRRTGVNQERIIRELARIAFVDPAKLANLDEATVRSSATEDDTAAIQSVKVKRSSSDTGESVEREIRFADKTRALELLGKRFGMWIEKQEVDMSAKVEIVDDVPAPDPSGEGE